jgi:hypothetical protein
MPVSDYFSDSYAEARDKFRSAARAAGARLASYSLPGLSGPSGEELSVGVALIGPQDARRGLLLISGTHGAEGFCGSGCQVGFCVDRLYEAFASDALVVLAHAVNPHGFAWLRRVNEDGVDLNRNFGDFTSPLPQSTAYEELHDHLVPPEWEGPAREAADAALNAYAQRHGLRAFQAAVTLGQYSRPTGLFYGGERATWSAQTIRRMLAEHIPATLESLAVIDLHTGLGPLAYGEPIFVGGSPEEHRRAVAWYGADVKNVSAGESVSAEVVGTMYSGIRGTLRDSVQLTYVALEFGTKPVDEVITALRADHWLHAVKNRETPLRARISRQLRDAFYVDTPAWKTAVYGRAADLIVRAARCLSA